MDINLVNLDANYYELVMQDKVNFTMQVEAKEKTKAATIKSLRVKVKKVQEVFSSKKLVAQLTYQTVNEEYDTSNNKMKKTGLFTGSSQLQIVSYDFDLVNEIVDQLIESEQAQVGQITTSISEKTKQAKEAEFTKKAIKVFQSKAKNIAEAFGSKDYILVNVSVNSADEYEARRGMSMSVSSIGGSMSSMSQEDSSSYISPRESKIYVTITGSVQLK